MWQVFYTQKRELYLDKNELGREEIHGLFYNKKSFAYTIYICYH